MSESPSPDSVKSERGDFVGPVLDFFRWLSEDGDFAGIKLADEMEDIDGMADRGVPIFHTNGPRRETLEPGGWKCG